LFTFAALVFSSSVLAAPAARVEFAVGNVSAAASDGRVRALVKGVAVEEGDTVNTNEGRVQLRFTDEGFVSLHPRTVFRVDQYRWSGVKDGSERSFFSLIEGGLRTITGRLAKYNRKAYRMSTVVATLGIRGTEYTMQLNGGLSGNVAEGEIEVCNAGGCLAVAAGQSYYVPDASTKPIFSNKQTDLPPPQPRGDAALVEGVAGGASGTVGGLVGAADGLLDATTSAALTTLNPAAGITSGLIATPVGAAGGMVTNVTTSPGTLANGIVGTSPQGVPIRLGF
jgi:FecR-like protein